MDIYVYNNKKCKKTQNTRFCITFDIKGDPKNYLKKNA